MRHALPALKASVALLLLGTSFYASAAPVACASEGGYCAFTGTRNVRYGTATNFVTKSLSGGTMCTNAVFGDPAYGVRKACSYEDDPPPPAMLACATEGGYCAFTGVRTVKYGTETRYVTKSLSGGTMCTNAVFGDPAYGVPKSCWYSGTLPPPPPPPTGNGQAPTRESIAGKPVTGPITAASGQVIENLHIVNPTGPCIHVPPNTTNVTIRDNEIGPCGASTPNSLRMEGIFIDSGASNVTIRKNVIHDMSTAVFAAGARHPIVFDRNLVYNIRGPMWQGQMIQMSGVRGGSGSSKITCNVKDGWNEPAPVAGVRSNEDHISLYNSLGNGPAAPIEIAYNRIRGNRVGGGRSGSGMQLGDGQNGGATDESGWYYVHNNTIVQTNGVAIGVAGGHDIRIEGNIVDNRGVDQNSQTGWAFANNNFSTSRACYNISYANNLATPSRLWAFNNGYFPDGSLAIGLGIYSTGTCSYTSNGNNFNDSTLAAVSNLTGSEATFSVPYAQCD